MRQNATWAIIVTLFLCGLAAGTPTYERYHGPYMPTAADEAGREVPGLIPRGGTITLDDTIIGSRWEMGTTWNDYQQNGTFGKQDAVDRDGFVHHVWTNGMNSGSSQRFTFYNVWDPSIQDFTVDGGSRIDAASRAGFVNVAVNNDGFAFPIFHQVLSGNPHSAGAIDFTPRLGAFTPGDIPHLSGDPQIIWPHVDMDVNGNLHTVHVQSGGTGHQFYARGIPYFSTEGNGDSIHWPEGFEDFGETDFITIDVACALHSPRIALAWLWDDTNNTNVGNNVFAKISEDGGLNWGTTIPVTNFTPVDVECVHNGGTAEQCDKDTLRPWIDLSALFDQNDQLHIAFSAWGWYYWLNFDGVDSVGPWIFNSRPSNIWHWGERDRQFSLVAENWNGTLDHQLGKNMMMCHRPNLAVDTTNGYLYCSYQQFDTAQYSELGYLMADAYVSVSTDGGTRWAVGTDVTQTYGGQNTPAPGSKSERDICLAKYVSNNRLHMQYMLDHDAGTSIWTSPEGVPTLNEEYYLSIPVDSISHSPLMPDRALRWDSTGFPNAVAERPALKPGQFTLYQNYPNPFNPTTTIQFDLASESLVSLKVFDILGREVTTLLNRSRMSAGVQMVSFDASGLASGVYFYRLTTPSVTQTRKMVVMK